MWELLIGLRAKVLSDDRVGEIVLFGSDKGERTVQLFFGNHHEWFLFTDVSVFESDFNRKMDEIDNEIHNLQEKKFSLLNFFRVFPNKLWK